MAIEENYESNDKGANKENSFNFIIYLETIQIL